MSADSGRSAPVSPGDADLVRLSLAGSAEASETLVRRFERPVYNLIVRMVRNEATAEDLTQDTFLKMFRALPTYKQDLRFSSWLLRIAHNTAIDHLRQRRLLTVGPTEDDEGEERDPLDALPDLDAISPEQSSRAARARRRQSTSRSIACGPTFAPWSCFGIRKAWTIRRSRRCWACRSGQSRHFCTGPAGNWPGNLGPPAGGLKLRRGPGRKANRT